MDTLHTLGLHEYGTPRQYSVREFLHLTRTAQLAATIIACHLYRIPSRSSCYHEFLLVHTERLVFIIERVLSNSGMRVISSNGGAARDTITIVRAREHHEYWRSTGYDPVCKGTLRWHQPFPSLFDIASIASIASTIFKHYNLYVRQCYFYARITLDAMARAFPSCSRQGTTSFSKGRLTILGSYKLSQVQLLVDLHATGCQGVVPSIETERHASRLVTPDILRGLAMSISSLQRFLAPLMSLELGPDVAIRHSDHMSGEVPEPGRYMESRQLGDNREDAPEVGAS